MLLPPKQSVLTRSLVIEPQFIIEGLKWIGRNSEVGFIHPDRWALVCRKPHETATSPK